MYSYSFTVDGSKVSCSIGKKIHVLYMTYSIGASQVSDLHDGQLALFPPHLILSFKIISPCLL